MIKEFSLSIGQLLGISTTIATLIAICICAVWSIIFNRIKESQNAEFQKQIEKQKSEFSKEIETLKAKNDKLNYISKTQFDAEFKIYQELSEPIFDMFFDVLKLFPMGLDYVPEDETERKNFYEKRYNNAMDNLLVFQKKLYVYAPFIPKHIYDMFDNFRVEARKQVNWYPDFILYPDKEIVHELREEKRKCWKRTEELQKQYNDIIDKLRNHLQSLKVMDGNNE
ncbi:MAG: hypothetical protein IJ681_07325 [Bacteroidales bacterium]|nr:hypothetical protein [Bacteroidales bacterium]